jgi:hypothetical protein
LNKSLQHGQPPSFAVGFLDLFDGAEIAAGGVSRVLRRHPAADVFLRETIQMRGDLIVEVGVTAAPVNEAAQS